MFTENKNSRTVGGTTERDNISKGNIQDSPILAQHRDEIKSRLDLHLQALDILHHANRPEGGMPSCLNRPNQTPAARRVLLRRMGFMALAEVGGVLILDGGLLVDLEQGYVCRRTEGGDRWVI